MAEEVERIFTKILYLVVALMVTRFILPSVLELLTSAGHVRPNFRQEMIPQSGGIIFLLVSLMMAPLLLFFTKGSYWFLFYSGIATMSVLGLIDDFLGGLEAKGLKGHFKKLFLERKLTTGALKAVGGAFLALMLTINEPLGHLVVDFLLIVLGINFMNLFDLRPGRAGKVFIFLAIILGIAYFTYPATAYLFLILGIVLAYLPFDLKAEVMMGDAGSNVLGFTLGYLGVVLFSLKIKIIVVLALILLHLFTEKYSLTTIIKNNRLLNYLDELGR